MFILSCILAGLAGTFLMTVFTNMGGRLTGYNFHVPTILGSMVTGKVQPSGKPYESPRTLGWGYTLHYAIGIGFAFLYRRINAEQAYISNYFHALIFGAAAGMVAVFFWFCFLKLHPLAPRIKLNLYLIMIFLGHLIFALGMNGTFHLISIFEKH
jgi:hypothetical protein